MRRILACIGCAAIAACAAPPRTPVTPSPVVDTALNAAVFDTVWSRIAATYYDPRMRGIDWTAAREELRPLAVRAANTPALRSVIQRLLDRLGESHFGIIPMEAVGHLQSREESSGAPGDIGVELRYLDRELVVTAVDTGSPAAAAGVRTGWMLTAVDTIRVDTVVAAAERARIAPALARLQIPGVFEARLRGSAGTAVNATFADGSGREVPLTIARRRAPGQVVRFGSLPPLVARLSQEIVRRDTSCVGIVKFSVWLPAIAAAFDSAMTAMQSCAGVVIDLRGNPGGLAAMIMGISGYFLERPDSLGVMRMRTNTLHFVTNPRRVTMTGMPLTSQRGALAIVVDERSVSTSEIFAAAMRQRGRARIFGRRSPGLAQPATMARLPNGDALMHVVADLTLRDGTRIEANGVVPDVESPLTRADLLAGRDRPLQEAVDWAFASGRRTAQP